MAAARIPSPPPFANASPLSPPAAFVQEETLEDRVSNCLENLYNKAYPYDHRLPYKRNDSEISEILSRIQNANPKDLYSNWYMVGLKDPANFTLQDKVHYVFGHVIWKEPRRFPQQPEVDEKESEPEASEAGASSNLSSSFENEIKELSLKAPFILFDPTKVISNTSFQRHLESIEILVRVENLGQVKRQLDILKSQVQEKLFEMLERFQDTDFGGILQDAIQRLDAHCNAIALKVSVAEVPLRKLQIESILASNQRHLALQYIFNLTWLRDRCTQGTQDHQTIDEICSEFRDKLSQTETAAVLFFCHVAAAKGCLARNRIAEAAGFTKQMKSLLPQIPQDYPLRGELETNLSELEERLSQMPVQILEEQSPVQMALDLEAQAQSLIDSSKFLEAIDLILSIYPLRDPLNEKSPEFVQIDAIRDRLVKRLDDKHKRILLCKRMLGLVARELGKKNYSAALAFMQKYNTHVANISGESSTVKLLKTEADRLKMFFPSRTGRVPRDMTDSKESGRRTPRRNALASSHPPENFMKDVKAFVQGAHPMQKEYEIEIDDQNGITHPEVVRYSALIQQLIALGQDEQAAECIAYFRGIKETYGIAAAAHPGTEKTLAAMKAHICFTSALLEASKVEKQIAANQKDAAIPGLVELYIEADRFKEETPIYQQLHLKADALFALLDKASRCAVKVGALVHNADALIDDKEIETALEVLEALQKIANDLDAGDPQRTQIEKEIARLTARAFPADEPD